MNISELVKMIEERTDENNSLINAVDELVEKNDELEAERDSLQARCEALERAVERICRTCDNVDEDFFPLIDTDRCETCKEDFFGYKTNWKFDEARFSAGKEGNNDE